MNDLDLIDTNNFIYTGPAESRMVKFRNFTSDSVVFRIIRKIFWTEFYCCNEKLIFPCLWPVLICLLSAIVYRIALYFFHF